MGDSLDLSSTTNKPTEIQQRVNALGVLAGALWVVACCIPTIGQWVGVTTWLLAYMLLPLGLLVTIVNIHVIISFWNAIVFFRTGTQKWVLYPWLPLPFLLLTLTYLGWLISDARRHVVDSIIPSMGLHFGFYLYTFALLLSAIRLCLIIGHRWSAKRAGVYADI